MSSVVPTLPTPQKSELYQKLFSSCRDEVCEDGKIWRHIYSFIFLHASCKERVIKPVQLHSLKDLKCSYVGNLSTYVYLYSEKKKNRISLYTQ
jgi:hypothetical protein